MACNWFWGIKKSIDANWPSGGVHFDLHVVKVSKASFSVASDWSSLSWKNAFSWTRRRNFSTSCLVVNSSVFLAIGTKLRPLLRTDFSASESGRFSGIVTTVFSFWFSRGAVLFFWGLVRFFSFWFLVWFKWLKSTLFRVWILVLIDCSTTEGHTLESWERHSVICLFSSFKKTGQHLSKTKTKTL